jgi:hypothetical protein
MESGKEKWEGKENFVNKHETVIDKSCIRLMHFLLVDFELFTRQKVRQKCEILFSITRFAHFA